MGSALAILLQRSGYPVRGIFSRTRTSAEKLAAQVPGSRIVDSPQAVAESAHLTFITTPDSAIPQVASQITWKPGMNAVHCSGSDSVAVLETASRAGAGTAGFHPLQTFAGVAQAIENVPGTTFAIEAEGELLKLLAAMAEDIGGRWITLKAEDKPAYHAAAVLACNYLVTLVSMSTDLWKTFDIPRETAVQALLPLIKGTLHNIETIGIPNCLTGPIARGDNGTLEKHLHTLAEKAPSLLAAYRELGLQTIPVALEKGKIGPGQAREMEDTLINEST